MYKVSIDTASGIAVLEFSGETSFADFVECFDELAIHPDFREGLMGVADLRGACMNMNDTDAERLGRHVLAGDTPLGRWALIVDRPFETALSVLYEEIVAHSHPVGIFSSVQGASVFLDHDLQPLLPD